MIFIVLLSRQVLSGWAEVSDINSSVFWF